MDKLKELEQLGGELPELALNINLSYLCADMSSLAILNAEKLLNKVDYKYHKQDKRFINTIKRQTIFLVNSLTKTLGNDMRDGFEDLSDFLFELVTLASKKCKTEESQLKLLSTLKTFKDDE